jgi:hypothetical protein
LPAEVLNPQPLRKAFACPPMVREIHHAAKTIS